MSYPMKDYKNNTDLPVALTYKKGGATTPASGQQFQTDIVDPNQSKSFSSGEELISAQVLPEQYKNNGGMEVAAEVFKNRDKLDKKMGPIS